MIFCKFFDNKLAQLKKLISIGFSVAKCHFLIDTIHQNISNNTKIRTELINNKCIEKNPDRSINIC